MRRSGGAKDAAAGVEQRRSALRLLALAVLTAVACLLALCVLQLRAAQHCHGGGAAARQDLRQGPGSAVPAQLMQQHQAAGSVQQQPLLQDLQPLPPPTNVSAEAAAGCLRPPYRCARTRGAALHASSGGMGSGRRMLPMQHCSPCSKP